MGITGTILDLSNLAFVLMQSQRKKEKYPTYQCAVTKAEVTWYVTAVSPYQVNAKRGTGWLLRLSWRYFRASRVGIGDCWNG